MFVFVSLDEEIDTAPFIEYAWGIGKSVFVPRMTSNPDHAEHVRITRDTNWNISSFGIREPETTPEEQVIHSDQISEKDVIVVPVLAFDTSLHRIGYGKGVYDRILASAKGTSIGIAYEFQKVKKLAPEPHDVALKAIATEERWYRAD